MNIAGELAGSGSIKIWLHKAINTQKAATSGPFILKLEKSLTAKTFQRPVLIPKHFMYLCIYLFIYLFIMLCLNVTEKKAEVLFFKCVESGRKVDKKLELHNAEYDKGNNELK